MNGSQAKTVVILGMHRSGTSMVGGILARLGINMGEKFREDRIISNPLGFYEDVDFLSLNNEILKEAGGSWENPPNLNQILAQKIKFGLKIKKIIYDKPQLWGWKDPRTSLTIRLFLPYITNGYFIVCHRDPEEVANSLYQRSRMPYDKAINLYNFYVEEIDNFFKDNPYLRKTELDYKNVISNPEETVEKIIKFLGEASATQTYS
ncbi:MAG: sulfotransferase family protein [Candidatus Thorarchaeota archaeon]